MGLCWLERASGVWRWLVLVVALLAFQLPAALAMPNIVYILCDDLGYGDVHCLNPEHGRISTPNMDRLASQGMIFTEAHASSAVCTPSRYSILTGRYNWRSRLQSEVLGGYGAPLIDRTRLTVASLLKQHGYTTAAVGKWHLGLTFGTTDGQRDLAKPLLDGPINHGFDSFFGIAASLDMEPFAFIQNDRFTEVPRRVQKGQRSVLQAPGFEEAEVLPTLTRKAEEIIAQGAAAKQPFFLYLALTSPHTPLVPTKEWQGKSPVGPYGDFVMETDWAIGRVMQSLAEHKVADNTLLLVTSDNGCSPFAGVRKLEAQGHFPSADRRGYKADIWDGGHHIPLMVRWPEKVRAGTTNSQLVSLTSLIATCAGLVGATLPADAGEDSVSLLPALMNAGSGAVSKPVVFHSIKGMFAIREGRWKLEFCPSSGGWSEPKPFSSAAAALPAVQLYDLDLDIHERTNVYAQHPEVVSRLTALMEQYIAQGRCTHGKQETNDVPVTLWKEGAPKAQSRSSKEAP
jgi:arylsulfatase A